jgi:hypothetical protein
MSTNHVLSALPLACLASVLAVVPANHASAATTMVTNCQDSGPGSLRDAIARAANDDTIDMSMLACREIQLTSGVIHIPQYKLSLAGGPPGLMKVDAGHRSQVFNHAGGGILRFSRMNIANGSALQGGCVYSAGSVELLTSKFHGCHAGPRTTSGRGGAIYAFKTVRLVHSWVTGNFATFLAGGIYAGGGVIANHSHISSNRARNRAALWATAGRSALLYSTISGNDGNTAIDVFGELTIANSTISGNTGVSDGWPTLVWDGGNGGESLAIINSTISENISSGAETIYLSQGPKSIVNSTIAFNQSVGSCDDPDLNFGTVVLGRRGSTLIDSTVISNNSCKGNQQYSVVGDINDSQGWALMGANNLITAPALLQLPADTITVNPGLLPLADNGGPTQTHRLPADSPAIDAGNNHAALDYDQRGPGFPRVVGGTADIGAFERQGP